ncbi:hypothetical protein Rsph17029_4132 (plasmid) [Cereibacter sphaeroides ATCC 17029]|nr:hypothetical protein Rsph17029_4132 [Cereibacter sphaeroides ATCC 17029]
MTSALDPTLQLTGRDPMGGLKGGHEAARCGVAGSMGCMLHALAGHQRGNCACQPQVSHPGGPALPGVATGEPLQAAPRQRQCRGPVVERMVGPIEMCQRYDAGAGRLVAAAWARGRGAQAGPTARPSAGRRRALAGRRGWTLRECGEVRPPALREGKVWGPWAVAPRRVGCRG